jgi:pimeloyl-ACP methyl ester carboxylesterase
MDRVPYDEFSMFHENAEEFGLPYDGPPTVRRTSVPISGDRTLSALVWGSEPPDLVLLHGGGQNAHTWDTVAMALGRPLVAIDLPGHGHSDNSQTGGEVATENAEDVAEAIRALAPDASLIVGMSMGGLTSIMLTAIAPELVRKLVLVDVVPSFDPVMAKRITDFVAGPETFPSLDDLLERTLAFNPTRSVSSLRRGILHNAFQLEDGSWQWRHRRQPPRSEGPSAEEMGKRMAALWDMVGEIKVPVTLVRGMAEGSVVTDEAEAELLARLPGAHVEHVEGAGHSVQGDKPVELAALIEAFLTTEG